VHLIYNYSLFFSHWQLFFASQKEGGAYAVTVHSAVKHLLFRCVRK